MRETTQGHHTDIPAAVLTTSLPLAKLVVQKAGTHAKYRGKNHQGEHYANPDIADEALVRGIQQLFTSVPEQDSTTSATAAAPAGKALQTVQQVEIGRRSDGGIVVGAGHS